ncbi:MAG: Gfo/Idh/MocA family oxidoreductase [Planctomycetota bacterium]|nr:Gfo/Idh/MocA family oxidoreductase [Planctomycetota bacterium]
MTHEPAPHAEHGQSRRSFLSTAALIAGAGALAACATKGKPVASAGATSPAPTAKPRVPLSEGETIRIGVIGTGGMGTGHVHAFCNIMKKNREKVHVVALADVNDLFVQKAQAHCQKEYPDVSVETYRDYRQLLARQDIHGVLIASPEHWHADHAIDALLAGKDVYLEKPMTLNLADALRLRKVVRANPELIMQVGTQYAAQPKYLEAKKLIESGELGPALWSQCSYCRNTPKGEWNYYGIDDKWQPGVNLDWEQWCRPIGKRAWDPKVYIRWRRYRECSTGIVGDLLVHEMTPLFAAMNNCGWPVRVSAMGAHHVDKEMENHDQVNLTVQFENGHTMIVAGNTNNEAGLEKMIRCQKGNIFLNSRHCVVRPERAWQAEVEERTINCPDVGDEQDQHRVNWLSCMRTRQQPFSDIEQGTKVMVCVDLATRAMWEGGSWSFDPKTMKATRA